AARTPRPRLGRRTKSHRLQQLRRAYDARAEYRSVSLRVLRLGGGRRDSSRCEARASGGIATVQDRERNGDADLSHVDLRPLVPPERPDVEIADQQVAG